MEDSEDPAARPRDLGGAVAHDVILQGAAPDACHVCVAGGVRAANAEPQPLDLPPAVVDQMQSDSPGTARQPCNHHFAPVDPQGSLLVGELAAELQCESAGIGGVCDGIVATA